MKLIVWCVQPASIVVRLVRANVAYRCSSDYDGLDGPNSLRRLFNNSINDKSIKALLNTPLLHPKRTLI